MDGLTGSGQALPPTLAGVRAVLAAIPEPRLVISAEETILVANPPACDLLGWEGSDLVGRSFDVLAPPGSSGQIEELRSDWAASPRPGSLGRGLDLHVLRSDGTEVPVDLTVAPVETDEGLVVIVSIRDVTVDHHDTRLFRALLEAAPDAVVIIDDMGVIRLVNQAVEQCFGWTREELVGESLSLLVPDRVAARHEELRASYHQDPHSRAMGLAGTLHAKRKDGSEFPVEISLAPVDTEDGPFVIADVRDVTERLAIDEEMRQGQERERVLAEANRIKDQFLATVSHELRTPLASIMGYCELVADEDGLTAQARRFMEIIMRNARREARLVDDLLTLVDMNEHRVTMHRELVDLGSLVRDAVESGLWRAGESGIRLTSEVPDRPVVAAFDPERIGQALDSLVSNALKFTPAGGVVHVLLEVDGRSASVEVTDTGMGIGDVDHDRVFDRLYRSPLAVSNEIPGAGIGLSIAASIVEAHDGDIRVVRSDETGSTFRIDLPLRPQRR